MKAHNILVIINLFGSAENFIGGQFSYLREHGYNMHLICCDDPKLKSFAEKHGIAHQPLYLKREGLSILSDLKALRQVCHYIKANNIDTIMAHQAKARLIGTLAGWLMRVPNRIIFAHGVLYETMHGVKRFVIKTMDKVVSAMAHKVVCVSKSVANVRLRDGINYSKKNYLLGKGTCGGIDTENMFNPSRFTKVYISELRSGLGLKDNDFVIGFCGRLVCDKGIIELIDAFTKLKHDNPNRSIKLMIIGKNEIRDSIPETTKQKIQLDKDIVFTGYVPHDVIAAYYILMDVFVLPSYREGFGMVTIEAGAMGVPAVVSRSTGCIDSIHEYYTGLFADITPVSLAESISKFFDDSYRRGMASNCRSYVVENYDHKVIWPHVIDVIEA